MEFSDDDEGAKLRLKEKVRQMMAKAIGQALAKTVRTVCMYVCMCVYDAACMYMILFY